MNYAVFIKLLLFIVLILSLLCSIVSGQERLFFLVSDLVSSGKPLIYKFISTNVTSWFHFLHPSSRGGGCQRGTRNRKTTRNFGKSPTKIRLKPKNRIRNKILGKPNNRTKNRLEPQTSDTPPPPATAHQLLVYEFFVYILGYCTIMAAHNRLSFLSPNSKRFDNLYLLLAS